MNVLEARNFSFANIISLRQNTQGSKKHNQMSAAATKTLLMYKINLSNVSTYTYVTTLRAPLNIGL